MSRSSEGIASISNPVLSLKIGCRTAHVRIINELRTNSSSLVPVRSVYSVECFFVSLSVCRFWPLNSHVTIFTMVTTKHCCYGTCRSDSRYQEREHMNGVFFIRFPTMCRQPEKARRWVRACGRRDFTVECLKKDTYMCSLHFPGEKGPTPLNPDPIPATATPEQVFINHGCV